MSLDISKQDECIVDTMVPAKKKKLKQARLPFQMLTSLESPNSVSNKKRKITSPLVEYKSPKVVKITAKENSASDEEKKLDNNLSNSQDAVECVDLTEEAQKNGVEEKDVSQEAEVSTVRDTPKRRSLGKRNKVQRNSGTSTSLSKFFVQNKEAEDSDSEMKSPMEMEEPLEDTDSTVKEERDSSSEEKQDSNEGKEEEDSEKLDRSISPTECSDSVTLSDNDDKEEEEEKKVAASAKVESPSLPKTPKLDRSIEKKQRKLTPKQQDKKLENARKREERERLKMEKEKKIEEERESKRREKEEKKKEKEEKEKAEKEQKLKEKKMKELKKQMELEQKQKEKEAKEEERRKREEAKEEERRKKEEEKLEAKRKKEKAASNFASFFVAKKQETKSTEDEKDLEAKNFMPFEVKADMKIAPISRRTLNDEEKSKLDEIFQVSNTEKSELYISQIKNKLIVPRTSGRTWPPEAKDNVVILDDDNDDEGTIVGQPVVAEDHRPKLLQFSENRRPPYWGTWRKRSKNVNPRRPFKKDVNCFDYDVDSDEEWEEEEPGESLHGSDDEKDEENPEDNEYDVDNEFMVPHGYLSDEEAQADEDEKEDMSPETQKFKLKLLGEQFECERQEKTSKLKPKMIGCIWQGPNNELPENVPSKVANFLLARQAWVFQVPVILSSKSENETSATGESTPPTKPQSGTSSKKSKVLREAVPDLIRLVHGNTHAKVFLAKEFIAYWTRKHEVGENRLSKISVAHKIREIGKWVACPEEGPMYLKACWYVPENVRKEYLPEGEEITLPNRWSYTLTPKRKSDYMDMLEKAEKEEKEKEKKNVPLITQFTKKITQEEMKKQLTAMSPNSNLKPPERRSPKRATLISVPRGQQFTEASRENLLKKFVTSGKSTEENVNRRKKSDNADDVDIIELIDSAEEGAEASQKHKKENTEKNDRIGINESTETKDEDNKTVISSSEGSSKKSENEAGTASDKVRVSTEKTEELVETPMEVDEP